MVTENVSISVVLTSEEAWEFAQFLKRVGHSFYRGLARDDEEAYLMFYAGEKVRAALADQGYAPR